MTDIDQGASRPLHGPPERIPAARRHRVTSRSGYDAHAAVRSRAATAPTGREADGRHSQERRSSRLGRRGTPRTGWWGLAFVVLLLISDVTVSLPLSSDPPGRIAALYADHRAGYLLAQVAGMVGVAVLARFVFLLRKAPSVGSRGVFVTGLAVAGVAATTNIPVLLLCLNPGLSPAAVSWMARAGDVTDWIQFATFAAFSAALALRPLPVWMRAWGAVAAVLLAADALTWIWPSGLLAIVAPLSVVVLVAAVSVRMIADRRPAIRFHTPGRAR